MRRHRLYLEVRQSLLNDAVPTGDTNRVPRGLSGPGAVTAADGSGHPTRPGYRGRLPGYSVTTVTRRSRTRHHGVAAVRDGPTLPTVARPSHLRRRIHRSTIAGTIALSIAVGACSGAAATPSPTATAAPSAAAVETAMASHSAMPSASAMASGGPKTVALGTFHPVDGSAKGTAALIHLADGSFEVTFEDFSTDSAAHTNVILVMNPDVARPPMSTRRHSSISVPSRARRGCRTLSSRRR